MPEIRSTSQKFQAENGKLWGYAALWDTPTRVSERGRTFTETIKRGAFTNTLKFNSDIVCTYNHNADFPLGRTSNHTLMLQEDDKGLRFEVSLPDTTLARDIRTLTEIGTIAGASYTFDVPENGDCWTENRSKRELRNVNLYELGPVLTPATPQTSVAMRCINFDLALRIREKINPSI